MFSKLLKARAAKEQAEKELGTSILALVKEFARLMALKAPITEDKAKEN